MSCLSCVPRHASHVCGAMLLMCAASCLFIMCECRAAWRTGTRSRRRRRRKMRPTRRRRWGRRGQWQCTCAQGNSGNADAVQGRVATQTRFREQWHMRSRLRQHACTAALLGRITTEAAARRATAHPYSADTAANHSSPDTRCCLVPQAEALTKKQRIALQVSVAHCGLWRVARAVYLCLGQQACGMASPAISADQAVISLHTEGVISLHTPPAESCGGGQEQAGEHWSGPHGSQVPAAGALGRHGDVHDGGAAQACAAVRYACAAAVWECCV